MFYKNTILSPGRYASDTDPIFVRTTDASDTDAPTDPIVRTDASRPFCPQDAMFYKNTILSPGRYASDTDPIFVRTTDASDTDAPTDPIVRTDASRPFCPQDAMRPIQTPL